MVDLVLAGKNNIGFDITADSAGPTFQLVADHPQTKLRAVDINQIVPLQQQA